MILSGFGSDKRVTDAFVNMIECGKAVLARSRTTRNWILWIDADRAQVWFAILPEGLKLLYRMDCHEDCD